MSLRLRLTLLYTILLGGVLLLFGGLVYGLVNLVLVNQVDRTLAAASDDLIGRLRINAYNQFDPRSLTNFQMTDNLLFQVWGADGELQIVRPPTITDPLDQKSLLAGELAYSTVTIDDLHLRVITVPLQSILGPAGIVQVAINLSILDTTRQTLGTVLLTLAVLAMVIGGLAAWLMITRAMAPLAKATEVATQITKADDLSRRIPVPQPAGDEVGRLITAFNQTLARMENLFDAQRRFLADVSHELRTPLTVIKGNVGLMRKMKSMDEESLSSIETEVDRLTRMVGDLLALEQAESGRLPLEKNPVEIDTVLLEVFQQMRVVATDKQIKVAEIDQVQVMGDHDRLKQVLLNLVANAIQYTPAGGVVTLGLARVQDKARITVTDTGSGIPAEDLPHIFERFYRAEKSRTRNPGSGFGLGLSIAYWIAQLHGGTIEVTSSEGKGSTFTVWLPAIPAPTLLPEPDSDEENISDV